MDFSPGPLHQQSEHLLQEFSVQTPHDYPVDTGNLAGYIDHTRLKVETTIADIERFCDDARRHTFAAVCFNPIYVAAAKRFLEGSNVQIATVVGFPLGAENTLTKAVDTRCAVSDGATEIDMVIAVGLLKSQEYEQVHHDIAEVVRAASGRPVKAIIESSDLTDREKVVACLIARDAGASYVKTSSGFGRGGATTNDVALMKYVVGPDMNVKASTGIKTRDDAIKMIRAGALRLGTSAGPTFS